MDQEKIGKFISKLRKEKNMTQEELAEKLGVSSKSISRWETGRNMPDLSLLKLLCEILGVSINELLSGERIKKNEFKKMLKKENNAFKKYLIYEVIFLVLLAVVVIPNIILTINNKIPLNITIINSILIVIIAIPFMIIDIKNDLEIKKMYQFYIKENIIPEYKEKTKILNIVLILSIVILVINVCITIPNIHQGEDLSKIENTLIITSNKGNEIKTQYEKFNGFKMKIPIEFKIMRDEIISIKYPNGNPPTLVYTNEKATINIALVMNDVVMKDSQIEEYVKMMKSTYKDYSKNIKINFWDRNNHRIGEMEFITQASDTEIYNHLIAFSVNNKLRLVNFNCTKKEMSEWQEISKFIVDSIIFE